MIFTAKTRIPSADSSSPSAKKNAWNWQPETSQSALRCTGPGLIHPTIYTSTSVLTGEAELFTLVAKEAVGFLLGPGVFSKSCELRVALEVPTPHHGASD